MTPYGNMELGQHWLMLRLRATLVKCGFPDSIAINQTHSRAKLHTAVLEKHSPADGTQPGNVVLNCKFKVLFNITLFSNAWTTLMHSNNMCDGQSGPSVPVANCFCEKHTASEAWPSRHFQSTAGRMSTAVCIYIVGLCAKLPGCVEGHPWDMSWLLTLCRTALVPTTLRPPQALHWGMN